MRDIDGVGDGVGQANVNSFKITLYVSRGRLLRLRAAPDVAESGVTFLRAVGDNETRTLESNAIDEPSGRYGWPWRLTVGMLRALGYQLGRQGVINEAWGVVSEVGG